MSDTRSMLPPRDLALVLCVIVAWGSNFTGMKLVLDELPPFLFVGLRFAILVPLIAFFPRPASWRAILAIGLLVNMGQFGFLFSAMRADVTAGLASLILQSQAPLTILLAAVVFGERVNGPQVAGIALACAGLAGFAVAGGGNITLVGLGLVLCGALSWACGNLVFRRLPGVNMAALFIWASLIPPLPMLALSYLVEGPAPFATIAAMGLSGWAGVFYVAIISTLRSLPPVFSRRSTTRLLVPACFMATTRSLNRSEAEGMPARISSTSSGASCPWRCWYVARAISRPSVIPESIQLSKASR